MSVASAIEQIPIDVLIVDELPHYRNPQYRDPYDREPASEPRITARRWLRPATIQRYTEMLDDLPAVVVFATEAGHIVADGLHRVTAARRLGRTTIAAEIRQGSAADALEFAIRANAHHGERLDDGEQYHAICRLKEIHAEWSLRQIATATGCSHTQVRRVLAADTVKTRIGGTAVPTLATRTLAAIADADKEQWEAITAIAARRRWTETQVSSAVAALKAPDAPESYKRALLQGQTDPLPVPDASKVDDDVAHRYPALFDLWPAERIVIADALDALPNAARNEYLGQIPKVDWQPRHSLLRQAQAVVNEVSWELGITPQAVRDRMDAGALSWPGITKIPPRPAAMTPVPKAETPEMQTQRMVRERFVNHVTAARSAFLALDPESVGSAVASDAAARETARQFIADSFLWLKALEGRLNASRTG